MDVYLSLCCVHSHFGWILQLVGDCAGEKYEKQKRCLFAVSGVSAVATRVW